MGVNRALFTGCVYHIDTFRRNKSLRGEVCVYSTSLTPSLSIEVLQKRCTRLAAASDKVYQLLAHGRWFLPGTPASSTTKTGRHDIVEILLKVALNTKNQIKSIEVPVPNQEGQRSCICVLGVIV